MTITIPRRLVLGCGIVALGVSAALVGCGGSEQAGGTGRPTEGSPATGGYAPYSVISSMVIQFSDSAFLTASPRDWTSILG